MRRGREVFAIVAGVLLLAACEPARALTLLRVEDARALFAKDTPDRLVRLDATLDAQRSAYPTGLVQPAFASCPPRQVSPATPKRLADPAQSRALMGCWTSLEAALADPAIPLAAGREEKAPARLASVVGTEFRVWVLSASEPNASSGRPRPFVGPLVPFASLDANRPELRAAAHELRERLAGERGITVPVDAVVLLADTRPQQEGKRAAPALIPIEGSGGALFAELSVGDLAHFDGELSGTLQIARSVDGFAGLGLVTGLSLPEHIGILQPKLMAKPLGDGNRTLEIALGGGAAATALVVLLLFWLRGLLAGGSAQGADGGPNGGKRADGGRPQPEGWVFGGDTLR